MNTISEEKEQKIKAAVDKAAAMANLFAPEFAAYVLIGSTIAKLAPDVYNDLVRLLTKGEPTAEVRADLARKLTFLANPDQA